MEADSLSFPENSFDVVVSRNITWNPQHPKEAYMEWHRVLKEGVYDHYTHTDVSAMEAIALQMPLSKELRPAWDTDILRPYFRITIKPDVGREVYSKEELVNYRATPMFMVHGVKEKHSATVPMHLW